MYPKGSHYLTLPHVTPHYHSQPQRTGLVLPYTALSVPILTSSLANELFISCRIGYQENRKISAQLYQQLLAFSGRKTPFLKSSGSPHLDHALLKTLDRRVDTHNRQHKTLYLIPYNSIVFETWDRRRLTFNIYEVENN